MADLETKILDFLATTEAPVPTKQIAQQCVDPAARKKMVNPTLYRLLRANRVSKVANDDGTNPRWSLAH